MAITAVPLSWPVGWKRTDPARRREAKFSKARQNQGNGRYVSARPLTIAEATQRVVDELARMGLSRDDVVVSSNLKLRLDGFPRSDQREPEDPGAAVYWQEAGSPARVMAIDQYHRVADNLAAIAATLEAMRAIERHGGAAILERAFTGFDALPAPGAARSWWEVLGVPAGATPTQIRDAYRRLASQHHPDRGGSEARMAEINDAYRKALP